RKERGRLQSHPTLLERLYGSTPDEGGTSLTPSGAVATLGKQVHSRIGGWRSVVRVGRDIAVAPHRPMGRGSIFRCTGVPVQRCCRQAPISSMKVVRCPAAQSFSSSAFWRRSPE